MSADPPPSTQESLRDIRDTLDVIAFELKRGNDSRDDFYREVADLLRALGEEGDPQRPVDPDDMCGMSNAFDLPASPGGFIRADGLVHCERRFGHVKNFHRGGGKQWRANP